jgi:orotidine-5'-phosphate decarboxylase
MKAVEKLKLKNQDQKFICVGLDPDPAKIPFHIKTSSDSIQLQVYRFNKEIIESTSDFAAAYKLNFAFYEIFGSVGFDLLKKTIELIPREILIIADAKRGDIGNTAKFYANSIFEYFGCDASTLNPYMGEDSISPFLEYQHKLNFILALTSNTGAADFEKLELKNGKKLYQAVCMKINEWNKHKNCGVVFGATQEKELEENFNLISGLPLLLPGIGAQGGNLETIVNLFKSKSKSDFLINISRGILYKSTGENYASEAKEELIFLNKKISTLLNS